MLRVLPVLLAAGSFGLALAVPVVAAEREALPALYDVSGVAADDQLNVRAAPDAGAEIIGALSHAQTHVEITATNDDQSWGRVNTGERAGWVSLAYMDRQAGSALPDAGALRCFGTEPFWSLDAVPGEDIGWSEPETTLPRLRADALRTAEGRFEPYVLTFGGPGQGGTLLIHPVETCSDGMSEQLYGLSGDVVLTGRAERAVSGCCSIQPQ